ncbi:uncharacterized protein LOC143149143 [Ptiloglossa arizonensis]|uniref:uncharacterized protein LOC143149143 n=1 Tax=Ptiloglossa arizonensis TaxID=3350558 RepID=UPI003F9EBFD0
MNRYIIIVRKERRKSKEVNQEHSMDEYVEGILCKFTGEGWREESLQRDKESRRAAVDGSGRDKHGGDEVSNWVWIYKEKEQRDT